jgi:outer membrane murein-binding lipoprotein Lpp
MKTLILIPFLFLVGCATQSSVEKLTKEIDFLTIKHMELKTEQDQLASKVDTLQGRDALMQREIDDVELQVKVLTKNMDNLFLKFQQK